MNKLDKAFEYMNSLIDSGVEYPDAEWKACLKFSVLAEDLTEMYDAGLLE